MELYNNTEDNAFEPLPPNGGEWERRDDYEDVNVATAAPKELLQTLAKKLRAVVEMAVAAVYLINARNSLMSSKRVCSSM